MYERTYRTVEPVIGWIKSVLGFRQFSLRGLLKVRGEGNLLRLRYYKDRVSVLRRS